MLGRYGGGESKLRVPTDQKLDAVYAKLGHYPWKSLRHRAQKTEISESFSLIATKLVKLESYNMT